MEIKRTSYDNTGTNMGDDTCCNLSINLIKVSTPEQAVCITRDYYDLNKIAYVATDKPVIGGSSIYNITAKIIIKDISEKNIIKLEKKLIILLIERYNEKIDYIEKRKIRRTKEADDQISLYEKMINEFGKSFRSEKLKKITDKITSR